MSPVEAPLAKGVGLPPAEFAAAFPFHLAVDRDLRVVQAGKTLLRLCPDVRPGAALAELFRPIRPEGEITRSWLLDNRTRFFLLEHHTTQLQLRGEFISLEGGESLVFLGSPWFTDATEIAARGLGFEEFAIHDPVVDLLQVHQASKLGLADAKKLATKLTAQRAELRLANERLRQQEAETRKLALIAARTDNAVVLTDTRGRIEWVNEGFVRLTGHPAEAAIGQKPGALLQGPGTDPDTIRRIRERLERGEGFCEEMLNYRRDGSSYWVAVEVQPIRDERGELTNFMGIERDVTASKEAERALRESRQRLAIQFAVSRVLTEVNNLTVAAPRVLEAVCRHLGWQAGQLWRVAGDHLRFSEVWNQPTMPHAELADASRDTKFARGEGLPGRVWAAAEPMWLPDVTQAVEDFPRRPAAARDGLRGALAFPIPVRGGVWGVAEFFSKNVEHPDAALLQTFAAVGEQIGLFIVRREAEEALLKSNALQRAILEGANYSIISAAPDGVIQTFNSAAERMLGYASSEMVGHAHLLVIHEVAEIAARAAELTRELGREVRFGFEVFAAKAARGQPDEHEWTYVRKDGTRFPVLLSFSALFDERGKVTGFLGIASDITERKRAAVELLQAKEAAEAANRAKSDFLAVMSHEIRTPMNAVLGMTQLLLQTGLDERQSEYARTVATSGEALIEIINEILDFSKIESGGHFQLEAEDFSLAELVRRVVQLLRPRAEAKGLALVVELAPGLPLACRGDDGRLRQVLLNLLGNSLKFTDRGEVRVAVRAVTTTARQIRLRCEISDTGIGITDHDMQRLFRPFTQADSSASRGRGGTGLGLAICKRIVELMGGEIGVESVLGKGSKFWFELPLAVADVPTAQAGAPPEAGASASAPAPASPPKTVRPLQILVAEDNETNRRLAMFMLEHLGYRADFAVNGRLAVEAWSRGNYDVIFMDCQMPEMDGFEATREIRKREADQAADLLKRVHIVALTANALKGDPERCLKAGMDAYMSKPFTSQQLREALEQRGNKPTPPVSRPAPPRSPAATGGFDPERPAQLCDDLGTEAVQAIIEEFLKDLPARCAEAEALNTAGDLAQLGRLAHSLQGIGFSLGLIEFGNLLRRLEQATGTGEAAEAARLAKSLTGVVEQGVAALKIWLASRPCC